MWIGLGVILDIMKWGQIANNRQAVPGYPQGETAPSFEPAPAEPALAEPKAEE